MSKPTKAPGAAKNNKLLHTFSIDYDSPQDDRRYVGTFTCKKLTIRDQLSLQVRKIQLSGGMHWDPNHPGVGIDFNTFYANSIAAHLEIAIVQAPDWWNIDEITDMGLLQKVYDEVIPFENSFLRTGFTRADAGGSEAAGAGSDSGGGPVAVVDAEVQAALEP